jgi:hypothetical protein
LRLIAKANDSMADDSLPSEMSLENALKLLGVREGASFEEILAAKKIMVENCSEDQARITQVLFPIWKSILAWEEQLLSTFSLGTQQW